MTDEFDDLLAANRAYGESFAYAEFDGVARAGVAIVTCMDSRIDPLGMVGLKPGDAKILRNPGGRVTDAVLVALVLGVNLLNVHRVMVIQHSHCTMAGHTEAELRASVGTSAGIDASWMRFGIIENQAAVIRDDLQRIRSHPLISQDVAVGGFLYDVETGLLTPAS